MSKSYSSLNLNEGEEAVVKNIEQDKKNLVSWLRKLIRFKTITPGEKGTPNLSEYNALKDFVSQILSRLNFTIDSWELTAEMSASPSGNETNKNLPVEGMPIVVGRLNSSDKGKSLILNGHYDVVPPGLKDKWKYPPFAGIFNSGRVYGRGACDMKGGLAAMFQAVKSIKEAGLEFQSELIIEVVPEEEWSGLGTIACCNRGYEAYSAIIPEPTNGNVLLAMRGGLSGKIKVFGRAGHSEMYTPHWTEGGAVNAISKSEKVLQAFRQLNKEWEERSDTHHELVPHNEIVITGIRGGEWPVMHPELVEIDLEANCIPGTDPDKFRREIENKVDEVVKLDSWLKHNPPELALEWTPGAEIDPGQPIVEAALEVATKLGLKSGPCGMGSLTDAVALISKKNIPTISIGPDDSTAHASNEFVDVEQLLEITKHLALTILHWYARD